MSAFTYLLDTNMFSYIAKGNSAAARRKWRRLSADRETAVCISVIAEAEVRCMAKHVPSRERADGIEGLLANLRILLWGSEEAAAYARTQAQLEAKGVTLFAMDILIAEQAIAADAVLVTRDQIFEQVPDLPSTANWASDLWSSAQYAIVAPSCATPFEFSAIVSAMVDTTPTPPSA
jgi:predicted nucleic acid-binding protein